MPFFIVLLLTPIGVAIALYRRNPRRFLDGPTEDAPLRLLRWALSLLSPQRAEWGQAMLGELAHLDGRWPRMRFALGCAAAALVMPPWGRAAVAFWATVGVAASTLAIYAVLFVDYRLGTGDWIMLAVLGIVCAGVLLGAIALLRRPGVALPGLLGGVFATLVWLGLSGLSAVDQVTFIPVGWQKGVTMFAVPAAIGIAGTLWLRSADGGRRAARLAALSAGLLELLYATIAVAILGGGGPPDQDGGFTLRGTVSDRLGNNIVHLAINTLFIAMVGWAAAALTGYLARRVLPPAGPPTSGPIQEA
ncbi:hypothetical protein ODJ79_09880 [Actinoplanes sp. KI2]|uniref:hypothetical protein n=1 Tax=Actinoplanes sp. KI2 TaxID=2983315 RepID=UPI0021D5D54C|nr:hypothetical protein [Actinoplanes sp. KI2]MCU7724023.1 hypothetical protein [Actinoplanes sp. KI2]